MLNQLRLTKSTILRAIILIINTINNLFIITAV